MWDTAYWGLLRVRTTFDIFQNILLLYYEYGVLVFSGYGVLILFPSWSLLSVGTDTPYLLAGYGVLRFETYVKAKYLDLWHTILNGDFPPVAKNEVTQILEVVPFEEQSDDLKKKLAKNNEAKMVLYNALPKNEYERIFMCKTAKDIWQSLLITHQGNSQVKDNKIDLLVQQYEQFTILEEESIDSGFARFNTIITSLKAPNEAIEESKDLSSLALDELIGNLKVHEVVMEKDSKIYRGKKERVKSIALKAKKESSDDETLTSGSDDSKKIKRPSLKVLGAIAEMTPKTKPMMKLVSWLNRQMR
ncbi:hypothetical protein Tco_0588490 [Tanacetum coccineum]